jgi:hypothetical protein
MANIEHNLQSKIWIATVTLQTVNDKYPDNNPKKNLAQNKNRMAALLRIISTLSSELKGDGVILLPGGWFHNGKESAESSFPIIEKKIKRVLRKIPAHIIISLGIDGSIDDEGYDIDQLAIAFDKTGIIAICRKFQVLTKRERERVHLAPDYLHGEQGKPRIFSLNGVRFFPAICYDTYGPQQQKLVNPGVDVILSHVHYFVPNNENGPKGVVDFVRKGFAGSSAQWNCPVFGSAIFIRRAIPKSWRTGMNYRTFSKPYIKCKINENSISPRMEFLDNQLKEGFVLVQVFDLDISLIKYDSTIET